MIVAFELSMPSNNAWNGRWSGAERCYARVINVGSAKKTRAKYEALIGSHRYNFGDGWCAAVEVREVSAEQARVLRKKSVGFYGYDWMIESIRMYGQILGDKQRHERAMALAAAGETA